MISLPLKFDEVESVEEFVNMVKRLDYDVDVKIGSPETRMRLWKPIRTISKHLKRNLRITFSKKKSRKGTVCKMHGVFFDARKSG